MNKLMFVAAGVAVAGSAFSAPLVYDYKASAKQMNLKEKTVKVNGSSINAYVKYQSSASLKGYLIVDSDGATSPALGCTLTSSQRDYGRNRAFLVVQNSKAEKAVRFPKILPAVIDAKWINEKVPNATQTTGIAEGYLYVGGDVKTAPTRPTIDLLNGTLAENGRAPAVGFIQDYCWTSVYLFGRYNGPLFFTGLWDAAQAAIDGNHETELQQPFTAGTSYFFHDSWMNGAGFGKWSTGKTLKPCCGAKVAGGRVLDSLSGNLKGGLFLCTENGTNLDGAYTLIDNKYWEDQFFAARLTDGSGTYGTDFDQTDLWQDGDLELNTTDCISGTWSIKLNTKLATVAPTAVELAALGAADGVVATYDSTDAQALVSTIKGAAVKLNQNVIFASGSEIWAEVTPYDDQVTFITPQFCKYYRLLKFN